jgi:hypothetical protein
LIGTRQRRGIGRDIAFENVFHVEPGDPLDMSTHMLANRWVSRQNAISKCPIKSTVWAPRAAVSSVATQRVVPPSTCVDSDVEGGIVRPAFAVASVRSD